MSSSAQGASVKSPSAKSPSARSRAARVDEREARTSPLKEPQRVAFSARGMVASAHHAATHAGVRILEEGGNAMDAAAAVAFALGVCEPAASGLGGQTMALVRLAAERRTIALDGSSRAPHRALLEQLTSDDLLTGHKATTVPSTPATLAYLVERYGRLPLEAVLQPAVDLAEDGFAVTELLRSLTRRVRRKLRASAAGGLFLFDRKVPAVGAVLQQPVLAATLRRLQRGGIADFYTGRIAALIQDDMIRNGGLLRRDDLAQIPHPIERRPLATRSGSRRVLTFPPPAAGRTLIEMLNIASALKPRELDFDTPKGAVILARMIRQAFLDRRDRPFDPATYPQLENRAMLDVEYARSIARKIRKDAVQPRGETTHLSVMDKDGNAVALTQSIERVFGSCTASPELGFLYNNYMSAFEYQDISHPYYLRPNAVPWASVAPTIVMRGPNAVTAIGSPGSERIAPSILQVLTRLQTQSPFEAVAAPRLHCALDGTVSLEVARFRDDIPPALLAAGFTIDEREPYSFYLGCVQLVLRERDGFVGVADPRRDGAAAGPQR